MHSEHAELISTMRREIEDLNRRLSRALEYKAICDAQEKLLIACDVSMRRSAETMREQGEMIDQLMKQVRAMSCP